MVNPLRLHILIVLWVCLSVTNSAVASPVDHWACTADPSWFSGKSIPAPSPDRFPGSPTNCDFHQISWQYFLWLTERVKGQLRLESLFSEEAIRPASKDARNENLHLVFQAGSLGILVDPEGRATYTSIMINQTYRDFVIDNELYDPEKLAAFAAATDFPVGSLSLKASWKVVGSRDEGSHFFTTKADLYSLAKVDGGVGFAANPVVIKNVKVALVGLHIAAVVEHHPEAIWATFEHIDNAPNMYPGLVPGEPVAEKDYTYYRAQTATNKPAKAMDCNQNNASIIDLDEQTQQLTPVTQVCRQYPYGGGKSSNRNNIESLNRSVSLQLDDKSVWRNYMEIGAVWLLADNGLIPNWNPHIKSEPAITGSVTLSSAIIETFTQNVRSQNNCFSCHHTMALMDTPDHVPILPGKNVNISHILLQNYVNGGAVNR